MSEDFFGLEQAAPKSDKKDESLLGLELEPEGRVDDDLGISKEEVKANANNDDTFDVNLKELNEGWREEHDSALQSFTDLSLSGNKICDDTKAAGVKSIFGTNFVEDMGSIWDDKGKSGNTAVKTNNMNDFWNTVPSTKTASNQQPDFSNDSQMQTNPQNHHLIQQQQQLLLLKKQQEQLLLQHDQQNRLLMQEKERDRLQKRRQEIKKQMKCRGLMQGSDKAFVKRMQLSQVASKDPITDDFYYYMYSLIHNRDYHHQSNVYGEGNRTNNNNNNLPYSPKISKAAAAEAVDEEKSSEFDLALGQVQRASVHKQKSRLDTSSNKSSNNTNSTTTPSSTPTADSPTEDDKKEPALASTEKTSMKMYRSILLSIEKGFQLLLNVEDKIRLQTLKPFEEEKMRNFIGDFYLSESDLFLRIMSIEKGQLLFTRSLAYLDVKQVLEAIQNILANAPKLDRLFFYYRRPKLVPCLSRAIAQFGKDKENSSKLVQKVLPSILAKKNDGQDNSHVLDLVKSKLGKEVLCALLHQYTTTVNGKDSKDSEKHEIQKLGLAFIGHLNEIIYPANDNTSWNLLLFVLPFIAAENKKIKVELSPIAQSGKMNNPDLKTIELIDFIMYQLSAP